MAGSGPPPSWNPRRSKGKVRLQELPAAGRKGRVPAWPLSTATRSERDAWKQLWATPQAVVWEEQRTHRVVARYCRVMVAAEAAGATAALLSECHALEDRLGLTPKAMRMLLWTIVAEPEPATEPEPGPTTRRLVAVEDSHG